MGSPLVQVNGVSKVFADVGTGSQRFRGWWQGLRGEQVTAEGHRALDNVSLTVRHGESVGLIGDNGAGKSTLLKILASVLLPSCGTVSVNGRIAALLELGAGFNPEFSGRENLALGAALMGVSTRQLKRKMDNILSFAELGKHLDRPLKHYSSGMVMRLGFALATALEPDLLITDEVLAVGDESFQRKCNRWVDQFVADGGTLLLVSHSMDQVRRLCQRSYWLKDGKVERQGPTDEVVDAYLKYHESKGVLEPDSHYSGAHYRLTQLEINATDGVLTSAGQLTINAQLHSPDGRPPVVALGLKDRHNTAIYGLTSEMEGIKPQRLSEHRFAFCLELDVSRLTPGRYQVTGHAMDPEALRLFDTTVREFTIENSLEAERQGPVEETDPVANRGFIRL